MERETTHRAVTQVVVQLLEELDVGDGHHWLSISGWPVESHASGDGHGPISSPSGYRPVHLALPRYGAWAIGW
jgi:hypothetical protein